MEKITNQVQLEAEAFWKTAQDRLKANGEVEELALSMETLSCMIEAGCVDSDQEASVAAKVEKLKSEIQGQWDAIC
jgi:hypothetical protein